MPAKAKDPKKQELLDEWIRARNSYQAILAELQALQKQNPDYARAQMIKQYNTMLEQARRAIEEIKKG